MRYRLGKRGLSGVLFWLLIWGLVAGGSRGHLAWGDEPFTAEQRMAAGLRARMLYDLADLYCAERLQRGELSAIDEANLVIETIQTQTARAISTPPAERAAAWERAQTLGTAFLAAHPEHPRRLLIRVQQGLAGLAEARLALQELAVRAETGVTSELALERLRAARSEFDAILRELRSELPAAPAKRDDSGRLTNLQLQALQANVEFQIGSCHLLRGELYDQDKLADRLDAFSSAEKSFDNVLKVTDAEGSLWYSVQLERVEVARLLGEREQARQRLASLDLQKLPQSLRSGYWEQQLELATAPQDVSRLLSEAARLEERSPQLELAGLRAVLRVANLAPESDRNRWLNLAAEGTRQIETRYGGYWGRVAELTLVGATGADSAEPALSTSPETRPANTSAGAIEILIRTGDNAAREKRAEDALRAWRKAIATAEEGPQSEATWGQVLQAHLKISRILEERQAFGEAAKELLGGVELQPEHRLAPWLQLQAAWCLAQVAAGSPQALSEYRQLLEQHLQKYGKEPTRNPALLWLARLEGSAGSYRRAADLYLQVDPTSEQALASATELARVNALYLQSLVAQPDRARTEAKSLSDAIAAKLAEVTGGKWLAQSAATRELLLAVASLDLRFDTLPAGQLRSWLENNLAGLAADDPWRERVTAYLSAALASEELQRGRALELVTTLQSTANLELAAELLESVSARNATANPIRLAVIERLMKVASESGLDSTELRLRQAAIWEAAGEAAKAIESLEVLATELPRRLDVQLRLARALAKASDRQAAALAQWRRVSAGVRDRSEEWYEAKYQVARLLLESGQVAEAKQLLDYLSVVPPGWGESKWKPEFDALHARCKRMN